VLPMRMAPAAAVAVVEIREEKIARRVCGIDAVMGVAVVDVLVSSFWGVVRAFRRCCVDEDGDDWMEYGMVL